MAGSTDYDTIVRSGGADLQCGFCIKELSFEFHKARRAQLPIYQVYKLTYTGSQSENLLFLTEIQNLIYSKYLTSLPTHFCHHLGKL